jgi:phenylalanyl-tRNA synthetase beta chain
MRILVSWLRDFVDVPGTPEEIAHTMSVRGFAVESIDPHGDGDAVLDFEVTANRPDCMSVIGIAREVATAYGLQVRRPAARGGDPTPSESGPGALRLASLKPVERADIEVLIENPDLCPRYVGAIADVTMGESPAWMQARLQAAGVRPISNVVDVTNYVMIELGQPMHAFDLARIGGGQIRVRTGRPGEKLKTLDGETRELTPDMLLIADAEQPIAIGGVMGGADSEVFETTTAIVLEAAYFNALSVRRTSKKLGLKTEASIRFERGADPRLPITAMERACALLETIGAGKARGTLVDRYPTRLEPGTLRLRKRKIKGLLGAEVPDTDVRRILESLGFALREAPDGWDITVPTRRVDCLREVDLIEEVARHYGFDRLPTTFPELEAPAAPVDPRVMRARHLRAVLTANGFFEAVTFGFISQRAAAAFAAPDEIVPVENPLSENFGVLRPSALPGLLDAVAHNRRREQRDVRLFEVGNRFSKSRGEGAVVACAWTGAGATEHWSGGAREVDFFDVKGVAERVCHALRVDDVATEVHRDEWLVPGRSAALVQGRTRLGVLGQLAPAVADAHGLPGNDAVYVAEIDLDAVEQVAHRGDATVEALPRYPSVTRDIAILIDETLPAETVRETIRRAAPPTLVRVREFDRYQGKGVADGKVSLALRLTFRSAERTLTDAEIQSAMEAIVGALKSTHGAVQR